MLCIVEFTFTILIELAPLFFRFPCVILWASVSKMVLMPYVYKCECDLDFSYNIIRLCLEAIL